MSRDNEVREEISWCADRLEAALHQKFVADANVFECKRKLAAAIDAAHAASAPSGATPPEGPRDA